MRNTILPAATTVTAGHLALLKAKVLTALMRRLDSSLFDKLLGGEGPIVSSSKGVGMSSKGVCFTANLLLA